MEKTREKKKLKSLNSQSAITLIALVVTIVVLLILAGVSLNLVLGENGIINKAKESRENHKRGEAEEEVHLYWGEVQTDYENTIEQQVEALQELLRKKDGEATAKLEDDGIVVKYKGYDIILPYMNQNSFGKITYFTWIPYKKDNMNKYACLYTTANSQIYILDEEGNRICLNDKFKELSNEKNLRAINNNTMMSRIQGFISDKRAWTLELNEGTDAFNLGNYNLIKGFDLEEDWGGKYKDNTIRSVTGNILLDNGSLYQERYGELEIISRTGLENIKFKNVSSIMLQYLRVLLIDENGKMYDYDTTENLSEQLYNGFFSTKDVKMANIISINNEQINVFVTEDGKAYIENKETNNVDCLNDRIDELKDKHIENIYTIYDEQLEEVYTAIILDDGIAYYTENMSEIHSLNSEGMPKLTSKS